MKEIIKNLYVGDQKEYEEMNPQGWYIIHACKEPYHRELLGYTGASAPKESKEYLWARRDDVLYMNLVDPRNVTFIPKALINKAISFIDEGLGKGKKVLVHCNMGNSRAPSIAFMYLMTVSSFEDFDEALAAFKIIYPKYEPSAGFQTFTKRFFKYR